MDGNAAAFHLPQLLRHLAVLPLQGQHDVGLVRVVGDPHRSARLGDRPLQPVAADRVRVNADEPPSRAQALAVGGRWFQHGRHGRHRRYSDRSWLLGLLRGADVDGPVLGSLPDLRARLQAPQQAVHGAGHVVVDGEAVPILDLDDYRERGWRLALQHRLLGSPLAGLLIAQRHRLYPADEIGEGRVEHQVFQRVAVGGGHQLHASLGDGAGRQGLRLGADLVDHDDFRHVVFDGLDHDVGLAGGVGHLHAPGMADGRVGHVPVPRDLVGRVHDDDALVEFIREHPGGFPQHGRLADSGPAKEQDAFAAFDHVPDDVDGAKHGAPDAAGEADDGALAVADRGDAVQGALDAGPVVVAKLTDPAHHVVDVLPGHRFLAQVDETVGKAGFRAAPQVQHDLQELREVVHSDQNIPDIGRQHVQQLLQVVHDFLALGHAAISHLPAAEATRTFGPSLSHTNPRTSAPCLRMSCKYSTACCDTSSP